MFLPASHSHADWAAGMDCLRRAQPQTDWREKSQMMTCVAWLREGTEDTVQGLQRLGVSLLFAGVLGKFSPVCPTFLSILAVLFLIRPLPQPSPAH